MSFADIFGKYSRSLILGLGLCAAASAAFGADRVPHTLHFQGSVTDAAKNPLERTLRMRFGIYTGSVRIWYAEYSTVEASNGAFSVDLGLSAQGGSALQPSSGEAAPSSMLPIGPELLAGADSSTPVELELEIYNGTTFETLDSRFPLASSAFALVADTVDGYDSSQLAKIDANGKVMASDGTPVIAADGSWIGLTAGLMGPTGADGAIGATGATGVGITGATGANGMNGPTGATGVTGVTGADGNAGGAGPMGATGATGAVGSAGVPGPTGVAGPQGIAGANGLNGTNGATGAAGATGVTGVGIAGATGAKGSTGATGATGSLLTVYYRYNSNTVSAAAVAADCGAGTAQVISGSCAGGPEMVGICPSSNGTTCTSASGAARYGLLTCNGNSIGHKVWATCF